MFLYLEVCIFIIECNVDGEGGGVMVRSQVGLSLRGVLYHKVHDGVSLREQSENIPQLVGLSPRQQLKFTFNRCSNGPQWGSPTGWLTFLPSPSCSNQRRLLRWPVRWTRGWSAATLCRSRSASYEYRPWAPSHSRQRSACPKRKAQHGVHVKYASSCL